MTVTQEILRLLLMGYRQLVSPWLPAACRFYPTCSVYTEQAIDKYGILKGVFYGLQRIARCHPGHSGGYDPVK
jgi:putative membrane protein insertion efficiency factor